MNSGVIAMTKFEMNEPKSKGGCDDERPGAVPSHPPMSSLTLLKRCIVIAIAFNLFTYGMLHFLKPLPTIEIKGVGSVVSSYRSGSATYVGDVRVHCIIFMFQRGGCNFNHFKETSEPLVVVAVRLKYLFPPVSAYVIQINKENGDLLYKNREHYLITYRRALQLQIALLTLCVVLSILQIYDDILGRRQV
jgi:hypothetical protein